MAEAGPSRADELRLVGDLRQIASVRRVMLAEGAEAGGEALVFSTGGGLDFWVAAGRMLDIGPLSWRGVQIAWQSPAGMRSLGPSAGSGEQRAFSRCFGGFLNTCGFDHIRQPAGAAPMHGSAPFNPGRLTAYGEDWDAEEPTLFCEGETVVWRYGSGGYRLRRRIEAPIRGASLRIRDTVEVIGPEPLPIVTLYHFNLGYPLVAEGLSVVFNGVPLDGVSACPEPAPSASRLHPALPGRNACRVDSPAGPSVAFRWDGQSLPFLQLWRDLRAGCGVFSVEPCNIGRLADGTNAVAKLTPPGQFERFELEIAFSER